MISIGAGLFLVDYLARELRPVQMLARTANVGRRIIEQVYPIFLPPGVAFRPPPQQPASLPQPFETIVRTGHSGVFLAMDVEGLAAMARENGCVIEVVPRVGDFIARGDALCRVHPAAALKPELLHASFAFGDERTAEQDPTFVFRILVDVASKALSPAINDPTTAVLAIDQIHHLVRQVGRRSLETGEVRDAGGNLRLLYRTPDWEDFVLLGLTEIRQFGSQSIQVARRLRAMLEHLCTVLPPERVQILREELRLLDCSVKRNFPDPEDRKAAGIGDLQGVGGSGGSGNGAAAAITAAAAETTNNEIRIHESMTKHE
jgi:uncharacterized membrane protein